MAEKIIDIKIDVDGSIDVHMSGFEGSECQNELDKISKILGKPVRYKKLASYYNENVNIQNNKIG